MDTTAIGVMLKDSPRLRLFMSLVAAACVGVDIAAVMLGDYTLRFTVALLALLCCTFASSADETTGATTFGFRVHPRQGWLFWIKSTAIVAAILLVILLGSGLVYLALGYSLPAPRLHLSSEIGPLIVWMCITVPLLEEVLYRLVFCPPVIAWVGVRLCIVLNGILFAGLHVLYGNPSPENVLGGFILCWAFLKSESLMIPILLHAGGNACALLANVMYFYWWNGTGW